MSLGEGGGDSIILSLGEGGGDLARQCDCKSKIADIFLGENCSSKLLLTTVSEL
jgi:hypothetical protein